MKRISLVFGVVVLLNGCSYSISPEMVEKADKTIPFEALRSDPESFKGRTLILGGTIAHITNTKQGTLLEVVQKSLDYWGKPERTDKSGGRFLVFHPGYLDAMVYSPGRGITVAGEVEGSKQKALGEIDYSYPVLLSRELKLWERERQSPGQPAWWDPLLYDPHGQARPN